jgi:hypothetical protein
MVSEFHLVAFNSGLPLFFRTFMTRFRGPQTKYLFNRNNPTSTQERVMPAHLKTPDRLDANSLKLSDKRKNEAKIVPRININYRSASTNARCHSSEWKIPCRSAGII